MAAAAAFAGAGGRGGGAPRMSTAATGCAVLAALLEPASAAVPSLPLPSSLPGEVFGGEVGAERPGVFATIALAAAMSAAAFGCEFGLFGSLGAFPVVPAACVVLPGVLAAVLLVAGVVPLLGAFDAEPLRF
jgi:hypothetical protein